MGLASPGGVHSHERQLAAMVALAAQGGVKRILVHAFLDGRDTPPRSAAASLAAMEAACAAHPGARIASIVGRYYAMDRDQRWDRQQQAYDLLVDGRAPFTAPTALAGLDAAYARGENDEFVKATAILDAAGHAAVIADGDVLVCMNFRADRARQLTRTLTDPAFDGFARSRVPALRRLRVPHVLRRGVRAPAGGLRAADDPQQPGRIPGVARTRATADRRNGEIRARHRISSTAASKASTRGSDTVRRHCKN